MFKTRGVSFTFLFCFVIFLFSDCAFCIVRRRLLCFIVHKWIMHLFQCVTYRKEKIILSRKKRRLCRLDDLLREKKVKCSEEKCLEAQEKSSFRLLQQMNIWLKKRSYIKANFFIKILSAFFFFRTKPLSYSVNNSLGDLKLLSTIQGHYLD